MSNAGYVAHSAFWNANESVIERIKLATLLYDRIHWSVEIPLDFAVVTAEVAAEASLANPTISELSEIWIGQPVDIPAYDIFTIDGLTNEVVKPEKHPELFAAAKSALVTEKMDVDRQYEDYKLAVYTVSEILYWRKYYPAQTFIGHSVSDKTLHAYAPSEGEGQSQEVAVSLPSLFDLSWNDIVSLRSSPYLKSFRDHYAMLSNLGKTHELFERYQATLEKLADEVRPTPLRNILIGVLSNLPVPTVLNPAGVASSLHTLHTDRRRAKTYGWAFFLREVRALARERP